MGKIFTAAHQHEHEFQGLIDAIKPQAEAIAEQLTTWLDEQEIRDVETRALALLELSTVVETVIQGQVTIVEISRKS